jgi:hypothetical protein
MRIRYRE